MLQIKFNVEHQIIKRLDTEKLASGSRNYVEAVFDFSSEWDGLIKTAVFKDSSAAYNVILEDNKCLVPAEVLARKGVFEVSIFGGDLITVTNAEVTVAKSGYSEGGTPADPTPSVYEQIIKMIEGIHPEIPVEEIQQIVVDYLKQHPVEAGISEEECRNIVKEISYTKAEIDEKLENIPSHSEIDDNNVSLTSTFSSQKITDFVEDEIAKIEVGSVYDDIETAKPYRYRVGLISDAHVDRGDGVNDLKKVLADLSKFGCDFVAFGGDVSSNTTVYNEAPYTKFKKVIEESDFSGKFYAVRGNHDSTCPLDTWKASTQAPANHYLVDLGNNDVMVMMSFGESENSSSQGEKYQDAIDWLETVKPQIDGKRQFIFIHYPFYNKAGLQINQNYGFFNGNEQGEILKAYFATQNCYVFGGHSHLGFDDAEINPIINIDKSDGATYIHIPSTTEIRGYNYYHDGTIDNDGKQGWVMDIYDNYITLAPIDFKANSIFEQYSVSDGSPIVAKSRKDLVRTLYTENQHTEDYPHPTDPSELPSGTEYAPTSVYDAFVSAIDKGKAIYADCVSSAKQIADAVLTTSQSRFTYLYGIARVFVAKIVSVFGSDSFEANVVGDVVSEKGENYIKATLTKAKDTICFVNTIALDSNKRYRIICDSFEHTGEEGKCWVELFNSTSRSNPRADTNSIGFSYVSAGQSNSYKWNIDGTEEPSMNVYKRLTEGFEFTVNAGGSYFAICMRVSSSAIVSGDITYSFTNLRIEEV